MTRPPPVVSEAMMQLVARALNSERGIAFTLPDRGAATNWRQRYYTCRKSVVKADPTSEWRTLTCIIEPVVPTPTCENCGGPLGPWRVKLIPNDAHILDMEIEEL